MTTATEPQATEAAIPASPVTKPVSKTINTPTPACKPRTRQGEACGLFCRHACACATVKGLNSASSPSSASSSLLPRLSVCVDEAILTISNYNQVTHLANAAKPLIIRRNPCLFIFFDTPPLQSKKFRLRTDSGDNRTLVRSTTNYKLIKGLRHVRLG